MENEKEIKLIHILWVYFFFLTWQRGERPSPTRSPLIFCSEDCVSPRGEAETDICPGNLGFLRCALGVVFTAPLSENTFLKKRVSGRAWLT